MIRIALFACLCLAAAPARATPEPYRLDPARSLVTFGYAFGGDRATGRIPIRSAEMRIDIEALATSHVQVALDARGARAGFLLATEAMRGPALLDAGQHPLILFRSTAIRGSLRSATVTGNLTIRGVTRPVTLRAAIYRQPGTARTDRDHLIVLLTGKISRAAFGATGYPGLVGDRIDLRILAYIEK